MSRFEPMFETRSAKLSSDFGYDWAVKLFGRNAIESLPKLERGPNKGKPKGFVHWKKAISSGYSRAYCQPVKPGTLVRAWIGEFQGSLEGDALYGRFMGRNQSICASASLLFEDNRKAWMKSNNDEWTDGD
jgi:hypothetical protein